MTKHCFYCSYPNKDTADRCISCGRSLQNIGTSQAQGPAWLMREGTVRPVEIVII
ncbi:hypothetical protein [Methanobrevibacter sp.]|uniref:hypothetical protein n=1 Tax=Methanobrevibacter sp. TaxID=66852 RepID=UPI0025F59BEC|nr:hypothetical protein [Methanobrevibacter sp.]MBQ2666531.1 hypothetical protein [Methanobrevibacter sp.]